MSEYQYYEWQTIGRLLTPEEQMEVDDLSSHIDVSGNRAVVTYNWGDFRHDPKQVLLTYFDAFFYCANWGTLQLMFRFPTGLLNKETISLYCDGAMVSFETIGDFDILDLDFFEEGYLREGWLEAECSLSGFLSLYDDLLTGDYRLLYLAWLGVNTFYNKFEDKLYEDFHLTNNPTLEPPVPPGLDELSASLQYFVRVFNVNQFLLSAAAEQSTTLIKTPEIDYNHLVLLLNETERNNFLVDFAEGKPGTAQSLRNRLSTFIPSKKTAYGDNRRSIHQLETRATQIKETEDLLFAEFSREMYKAEMDSLALRENQIWEEVEHLIEHGRRGSSVYDQITQQLKELAELAVYRHTCSEFESRIEILAAKYPNRRALIRRWQDEGWL